MCVHTYLPHIHRCPSLTTTPGQPGHGDTSRGRGDAVGLGKRGESRLEEGTLMQELFQQFPPGSSEAKGEPAAACALPTGAISSPCTHLSLQQTPAVRCGQGHRHRDFPDPVSSHVSMSQLSFCPARAPQPCPTPKWGMVPVQGNATHSAKPSSTQAGAGTPLHSTTHVSQVGEGGLRCVCTQQSQAPDMVTWSLQDEMPHQKPPPALSKAVTPVLPHRRRAVG